MLLNQAKTLCKCTQTKLCNYLKQAQIFRQLSSIKPDFSGQVPMKPCNFHLTKRDGFQQSHKRNISHRTCSGPSVRTFHRDAATNGQEVVISDSHQTAIEDLTLHKMSHRSLLCVEGPDTINFLQGLLTSDVTLLGPHSPAQCSMMLNAQGRVLYDLILYIMDSKILIECAANVQDDFIKTMNKYKIRKKVKISRVDDELTLQAAVTSSESGSSFLPSWNEGVFCVKDPRVNGFGWRLIHSASVKVCAEDIEEKDVCLYNEKRYIWGISEGTTDLPPGECFPLESNLALFDGVSFSKGCYIGQELTARTHHTGVTRKRLMPLVFQSMPSELQSGSNIMHPDGKKVGKFRNCVGFHGIGLMRIAEIKDELCVCNSNGDKLKLTAHVPNWWST